MMIHRTRADMTVPATDRMVMVLVERVEHNVTWDMSPRKRSWGIGRCRFVPDANGYAAEPKWTIIGWRGEPLGADTCDGVSVVEWCEILWPEWDDDTQEGP